MFFDFNFIRESNKLRCIFFFLIVEVIGKKKNLNGNCINNREYGLSHCVLKQRYIWNYQSDKV